MTPEELKAKLLELAAPLDAFMRQHGIASFSLDDATTDNAETFDLSCFRRPLPPQIKCVLESYGCIYLIDPPPPQRADEGYAPEAR